MLDPERTWLASILFMDIVGYSLLPVDRQLAIKQDFNDRVRPLVGTLDPAECVTIDTGDGMALCHLGDPGPLFDCARLLFAGFQACDYGVRLGMNLGPIRVVEDLNGQTNCVGEGINTAQRIMDFANGRQFLVSRSYFDIVARLSAGYAEQFRPFGQRQDKHGRSHELFEFHPEVESASATPAASEHFDAAALGRVSERYARYVGRERAQREIERLRASSGSTAALVRELADSLGADDRYDFEQYLRYYGIGGY